MLSAFVTFLNSFTCNEENQDLVDATQTKNKNKDESSLADCTQEETGIIFWFLKI